MTEFDKSIETSTLQTKQPQNKKPKLLFKSFLKILFVLIIFCILGTFCFLTIHYGYNAILSIEEKIHTQNEEIKQLQQLIEQQKETSQKLEQNVLHITQTITAPGQIWQQEELKFIFHSASLQLHVYHDIPGAIALLEMADQLVQSSSNQNEINIHHKLIEKITILKTIPQIDLVATHIKLQIIGDQIEKLPLVAKTSPAIKTQDSDKANITSNPKSSLIEQLKTLFYTTAKKIFIIRKYPEAIQPLLSPEELKLININVHLLLAEAEWSLLEKQPAIYIAALAQIEKIIQTCFAATKEQEALLQEINSLKTISFNSTLPPLDDVFTNYATTVKASALEAKHS